MAGRSSVISQTGARKTRAWLQFVSGQLQIIGATAGLLLLFTVGVRKPTVIVAGVTLVITLVSRMIFSRRQNTRN